MQFYYGSQMPLRVLDECEFWKLQEAEHTVVIRQAVPNLEERYVNDLKQWEVTLQPKPSTRDPLYRNSHSLWGELFHRPCIII